ncbi:MAG: molybdopterin converting factor subunit 1 [Sphingomonas sanxanigenens]|uniref:Molybdopterin synthase sulfur carrier subunit n=1 Tax=Sphingomonas sanxanigenens TaxID=397260 RepID=A0A2W5AC87_9SPHN|nr:MAG: molybdopterin converting factor subunit 1 [Sphingomonas sanxanigenens]
MRVLYFAWVREAIGRDEEVADPPAEVSTVDALIDWLAARGGGYAGALAEKGRLRCAVDQQFAPLSAPIAGAREVAIFPPVTGG